MPRARCGPARPRDRSSSSATGAAPAVRRLAESFEVRLGRPRAAGEQITAKAGVKGERPLGQERLRAALVRWALRRGMLRESGRRSSGASRCSRSRVALAAHRQERPARTPARSPQPGSGRARTRRPRRAHRGRIGRVSQSSRPARSVAPGMLTWIERRTSQRATSKNRNGIRNAMVGRQTTRQLASIDATIVSRKRAARTSRRRPSSGRSGAARRLHSAVEFGPERRPWLDPNQAPAPAAMCSPHPRGIRHRRRRRSAHVADRSGAGSRRGRRAGGVACPAWLGCTETSVGVAYLGRCFLDGHTVAGIGPEGASGPSTALSP